MDSYENGYHCGYLALNPKPKALNQALRGLREQSQGAAFRFRDRCSEGCPRRTGRRPLSFELIMGLGFL